jgi:hypothetical protein
MKVQEAAVASEDEAFDRKSKKRVELSDDERAFKDENVYDEAEE